MIKFSLSRIRSAVATMIAVATTPCFLGVPLQAGGLADFEKAATEQPAKTEESTPHQHKGKSSDGTTSESTVTGNTIGTDFLQSIIVLLAHSGVVTMRRVQGPDESDSGGPEVREIGGPDIPFVGGDVNYQRINSRTKGVDARVHAGYGPFAAQIRQTQYREDGASDPLNFIQLHGVYRMSWNRSAELGLGFGRLILDGRNRNSGFSMTCPLSVYPTKHFGLNFTPTWSWINENAIMDLDGSLAYVNKFYSVRVGYRRIKVNNEALSGPYVGLSFHY